MLKKQTVWLLTMLSLLIVLSVYYIMSPRDNDLAFINQGENNKEEIVQTDSGSQETEGAEVTDITNLTKDELFTTIRMELQDDRSMEKDRLESIVSSSTTSMEEKNSALQGIDSIETTTTTEKILEETIISEAGYEDVLVRNSNGDKVHVHVRTDELTPDEALKIMQMVRDEFDRDITVEVNYQPVVGE